jgi:hypothetical protein
MTQSMRYCRHFSNKTSAYSVSLLLTGGVKKRPANPSTQSPAATAEQSEANTCTAYPLEDNDSAKSIRYVRRPMLVKRRFMYMSECANSYGFLVMSYELIKLI